VIFALGSVLAAQADSIWGVIAGRILQGAGAISAAVMALLSDLTREQHRTKAMAMIGMSIGLSFAVAMVVGPLLTRAFGCRIVLATAAWPWSASLIVRRARTHHPAAPRVRRGPPGLGRPCAIRTCCAWTWASSSCTPS
jgi:MFS family permease